MPKPTTIQTLIFSKEKFNSGTAREWAERNGFKGGKVDETDVSLRLRQGDPAEFVDGSLRTITLTDGVKAVIGRPKAAATAAWPEQVTLDALRDEFRSVAHRLALLDAYDFLLGKDPPTEVRIFRAGENPSTKGTYDFSPAAAALLMAQYERMGRRVAWDYDHGSMRKDAVDPSKSSKAAGNCALELRAGELWAVDIKWTPEAEQGIRDGEWLYFSPAFTYDEALQPDWLISIGLTNNPALYGLEQLTALGAVAYRGFPIDDGPWDADAATHRLRRWASSDGSGDSDKMDWRKYGEGFAYVRAPGNKFGDFVLPHHDVRHGELVTSRRGVIAAAAAIQGARGGVNIPTEDLPAVKAHLASHYHQWDARAPWESNQQEMSMGLAKYSDIPAFLKEAKKSKADAAKAMGVKMADLDDMIDGDGDMSDAHKVALRKLKAADALDVEGDNQTTRAPASDMPPFGDSGVQSPGPAAKANAFDSRSFAAALGVFDARVDEREILVRAAREHGAVVELCNATGERDVSKAIRKVAELAAFARDVRQATGQSSDEDAVAFVAELSADSKEIRAAAKKVREDRVTAALNSALAAGKIVPAMVDGPHGLRAVGRENPERLEAQLNAIPANKALGALGATFTQPTVPEHVSSGGGDAQLNVAGKKYEQLSFNERHDLHSANPQAFAALRADWEQRGRPAAPAKPAN